MKNGRFKFLLICNTTTKIHVKWKKRQTDNFESLSNEIELFFLYIKLDYFENSFLMKVTSRYITSNLVWTKLSCFSCILFKSYSNLVQTKLSCLSCIIDYLVKNEPVPVAALVNELLDCSRVGVTLEVPVHSDPDQVVTNSRTKI